MKAPASKLAHPKQTVRRRLDSLAVQGYELFAIEKQPSGARRRSAPAGSPR